METGSRKICFLNDAYSFFTLAFMIGIVDYDLRYHLPVELIMIIFSAYGGMVLFEKTRREIRLR